MVMTEFKIITARIPQKLKEKIDHYHLNISKIIRKALEDEIQLKEKETLQKSLEELQTNLKQLPPKTFEKLIREDRDSR